MMNIALSRIQVGVVGSEYIFNNGQRLLDAAEMLAVLFLGEFTYPAQSKVLSSTC
jgi:hypothetical protein